MDLQQPGHDDHDLGHDHDLEDAFNLFMILAPVEDVDEGEIGDSSKEHRHRSVV